MRRIVAVVFGSTTLFLAGALAAGAADMPIKAPPAALPAAAPGWTGFYAGVDVGYGWSDPTVTFSGNNSASSCVLAGCLSGGTPVGPARFDTHGVFGGPEAGYNWQVARNWLVGVETDFNFSSIQGQGSVFALEQGPPNTVFNEQLSASQRIDWFGTVRARAGWLATDNLLLYGTGGFAYGRVDETVNWGFNPGGTLNGLPNTWICPGGFGGCMPGTSSRIAAGWTAGGGIEYRVPGSNASFKIEYLFVNLGAGNHVVGTAQNFVPGTSPASFTAAYSQTEFQTVKLGLNWKL